MPGFNTGNNPKLVKTAIDDVLFSEFDYPVLPGLATAENALLFQQDSTSKGAEITLEFSGVGRFDKHDEEESRVLATVRTGNEKTHTVDTWKKTLAIPQEFFEDDQHASVNGAIRDIARNAKITRDTNAIVDSSYGDGFSGVLTSDAVALFSDSHTNLNGDTIDNLETGTLGAANLEILFRVLMEQKGQDGELGAHEPIALLVPTLLWPDAQEVMKSELKPGLTDNDLNYFSTAWPGVQIFHTPLLGSTYNGATNANTSYYLVSRNHSIMRWVRVPMQTEMVPPTTDLQDRWFYKARFREVVSPISWEGLVASNGTA